LEVASEYFRSGADKISIGSDAVYAAEEYLRTGVCLPMFNSLTIRANVHASLCIGVCMCVPFDKFCLSFISGKDWKE
jgi:imidazole glycerol phosphate synthase subunit HisF